MMHSRYSPRVPSGAIIETPVGALRAVARAEGLALLEYPERAARAHGEDGPWQGPEDTSGQRHLETVRAELAAYFAGELFAFTVPVVLGGTAFQREVWDELMRIPFGQTRTYAEIGTAIGRPGSDRAVGAANGANRISIVVPCHRVIGAKARLTGYGGGLENKRFLLELEGALGVQGRLFG